MNRILFTALFSAIVWSAALAVLAADKKSSVQLFAAYETVRPGDRLPVAVKINVADGWHTYAKEPGDSGMPPSFVFSGPDGLEVGEWRFPPHETFTDATGTSYGYEHQVVLLSDVLIPESVPADSTVELKVVMKWMICRNICVFMRDEQTLSVQTGAVSSGPSPEWKALLKESRREELSEAKQGTEFPGKEIR